MRKFETKDPKKKKNIKRKYTNPSKKLNLKTSSTKKAKCPVTLVVKRWTARKPATFTTPATKDSSDAIFKLWLKVRVLPWCLNILSFFFLCQDLGTIATIPPTAYNWKFGEDTDVGKGHRPWRRKSPRKMAYRKLVKTPILDKENKRTPRLTNCNQDDDASMIF